MKSRVRGEDNEVVYSVWKAKILGLRNRRKVLDIALLEITSHKLQVRNSNYYELIYILGTCSIPHK